MSLGPGPPGDSALWRTSFAIIAIGGAAVLIALRGAAVGKLGLAAYIFTLPCTP